MLRNSTAVPAALANPLCVLLNKDKHAFTRQDMLRAIRHFGVEIITFHYTGLDGRLKQLALPFSDIPTADRILAMGERVDGSSLFKGMVDSAISDLYVVPRYCTAFLNPFDNKSLDFVCRFLKSDGNLAPFTPDNILEFAQERITTRHSCQLRALGELEFYLVSPSVCPNQLYPADEQDGYHSCEPFFKHGAILNEIARAVQQVTGSLKYAHAEVGYIESLNSDSPLLNGHTAEQYELELRTQPIQDMGDSLNLARWIIRTIAYRHNMLATFAPKIQEGAAGSGLHVHLELLRDNANIMLDSEGTLSDSALKLIGGLVRFAPSLTAFGNTVASSYLRLVPNQEAPTKICWSHSNRSSLIRIPLGWSGVHDLANMINPQETQSYTDSRGSQTVELRSPDGSAHTYLLLAALATAADWGLQNPDSRDIAKACQVRGNVFQSNNQDKLVSLPPSCHASAKTLQKDRALYEENGLFPKSLVDYVIALLEQQNDETLVDKLATLEPEERSRFLIQILQSELYRH